MKELEIKGYPTLIGKDATTGEIKWEKTLKNTLTMHERMWRAYASSINATIPTGDITRIETDSVGSLEGDSMSIIMTLIGFLIYIDFLVQCIVLMDLIAVLRTALSHIVT